MIWHSLWLCWLYIWATSVTNLLIKVIHRLLWTCSLPGFLLWGLLVLLTSFVRLSLLLNFLIAPPLLGLSLSHNSTFIKVILITHIALARVGLLLILRRSLVDFSSASVVHLLFALISPCVLLLYPTIASLSSIWSHSYIFLCILVLSAIWSSLFVLLLILLSFMILMLHLGGILWWSPIELFKASILHAILLRNNLLAMDRLRFRLMLSLRVRPLPDLLVAGVGVITSILWLIDIPTMILILAIFPGRLVILTHLKYD